MTSIVGISALDVKAQMHRARIYHAFMQKNRRLRQVLGDNIKPLRELHEMTQASVAKAAGSKQLDQTTVGRIENAAIATTIDKVALLAKAFGVEPWQLFVEGFDPKRPPALGAPTGADVRFWKSLQESAKQLGLMESEKWDTKTERRTGRDRRSPHGGRTAGGGGSARTFQDKERPS